MEFYSTKRDRMMTLLKKEQGLLVV